MAFGIQPSNNFSVLVSQGCLQLFHPELGRVAPKPAADERMDVHDCTGIS